ncbi:hypothetical protein EOF19_23125 [Salmonella enterica]|nr:hypothetical protein [Salmonella enterica]EBR0406995.1 hypothetical protein [Salmonella enterica subsp. enterica serovar Virchow]
MLSSQTELKVRLWQGILIIPKISIIHELHHNRGRPVYIQYIARQQEKQFIRKDIRKRFRIYCAQVNKGTEI